LEQSLPITGIRLWPEILDDQAMVFPVIDQFGTTNEAIANQ
jgi:hypothetical protein